MPRNRRTRNGNLTNRKRGKKRSSIPRSVQPGPLKEGFSIHTRYSVRLTQGSTGTTNSYIFRPMLAHFDEQVGDFWRFFQFYRINNFQIRLLNCMNVSANNTTTIYQLPYVVMVPVRNGDLPLDMQYALSYKGAKHGILDSKGLMLSTKPYV